MCDFGDVDDYLVKIDSTVGSDATGRHHQLAHSGLEHNHAVRCNKPDLSARDCSEDCVPPDGPGDDIVVLMVADCYYGGVDYDGDGDDYDDRLHHLYLLCPLGLLLWPTH